MIQFSVHLIMYLFDLGLGYVILIQRGSLFGIVFRNAKKKSKVAQTKLKKSAMSFRNVFFYLFKCLEKQTKVHTQKIEAQKRSNQVK